MGVAWLFKSKPSLRLHDGKEVSNMSIAVELRLLFSSQGSSFRPLRKFQHSLSIGVFKINREQKFGGAGRHFILMRPY